MLNSTITPLDMFATLVEKHLRKAKIVQLILETAKSFIQSLKESELVIKNLLYTGFVLN